VIFARDLRDKATCICEEISGYILINAYVNCALTRNAILRLADYTAKSIEHASGVLATDFPDCSHFLDATLLRQQGHLAERCALIKGRSCDRYGQPKEFCTLVFGY
jgi:hypothetical protein